ncbi:AI-2E family transporter [Roseicella frigidaeris]|uniref:AI-2E family transporter n=1 Tax=Roseicella frigidaeris TaxID=2230885 RepID=A0A327MEL7_9PROT|nr:AI-2E family transporter [Roseicella frigidaeris]RAI58628.1 AI-2E family transporter [Roseicella frigidaeris]
MPGSQPIEDIPPRLPGAQPPGLRALMTLAVGVVVVAALYLAQEVLIPITLAVLLSFVLAPLVELLRRLWLGRVPAVLLAVLLALGAILLIGGLIGTQVASLAADAPRYAMTIEHKVGAVREATIGRLNAIAGRFTHSGAEPGQAALPGPAQPEVETAPKAGAAQPQQAGSDSTTSPLDLAQRILAPVLGPLGTTAIVLVVTVFMLLQREDMRDRIIRLAGATDLHRTTTALNDAAHRLSRYFLAQLGINVLFGCIIGLGLFLIGVPSPLLWGILAALLRFVPYIGAPLAGALPVALAAAVDPGWSLALWTTGLFLVTEPIMGQVVEPMVYGHSTGLSPIAVVIAAIFWSWLWGPIGLILSTPLTLCLVVLGRHVEQLEFLDVLLGDEPALTPVESFYQRLLADDPDEALDQAELMLKQVPLSTYYDEVALKGLQLAARDVNRGVLPREQLRTIRDSIHGLVEDLEAYPDADPKLAKAAGRAGQGAPDRAAAGMAPAGWGEKATILCIAGRGPLDEAAAGMLAQLLRKHGFGTEVVPYQAVSRSRVQALDIAGARMACLLYLDLSGSPAHLRHLLRRLRERLPDRPVLVGLWPEGEPVLRDRQLQVALGTDQVATTLREAVQACLQVARQSDAAPPAAPSSAPRAAPPAAPLADPP